MSCLCQGVGDKPVRILFSRVLAWQVTAHFGTQTGMALAQNSSVKLCSNEREICKFPLLFAGQTLAWASVIRTYKA